uniref:Uncharacterized protein n=2 Tax=Oryza TaxID=4527 RepID=A0A0D3FWD6_9ORYZ
MESSEIPNFFRDVTYRCRVIRTFGKRKPGQDRHLRSKKVNLICSPEMIPEMMEYLKIVLPQGIEVPD